MQEPVRDAVVTSTFRARSEPNCAYRMMQIQAGRLPLTQDEYTPADVAERYGVHRDTVYKGVRSGDGMYPMPRPATGDRPRLAFTKEAVAICDRNRIAVYKRTPSWYSLRGVVKEAPPPLKAKMVWQGNDGRTAASAKVDELLAAVSQLACEKYITDHVTADYKDPIYTLELEGQKAHRLSIFAKQNETDTSYPAVSSDSSYPFLLADWKAKQLMPAFGDLFETPK